ncbi:MAG: integrase/recombinase XerC, partial [bacterium]
MNVKATDNDTSAAWRTALVRFDEDLRRRGSALKTRDAYGSDLRQFAYWATALQADPAAVNHRLLRRYAAALSERRAAPATVARKLAALRSFFGMLREHGEIEANPADLLAAPKLGSELPAVLAPDQVSRLLDRIPASTPLELRDRALFEIAYSSGLRAEELVRLDIGSVDFDAEQLRVEGKGSKTRMVPAGEPALRALARYLERARAALSRGVDEPALFLSKSGRRLSTSDVRRRLSVWSRHAAMQ